MKRNIIKDFFNILRFKSISHKKTITSKGDCYINYIINKYINGAKPEDYIETYEEMISKNEPRVRAVPAFDILYKKEDGTEDEAMVHFLAANFALSMILMSLQEKEVEHYLNLIEDERARKLINAMCHPDKGRKILTTNN